MFTAQNTKVSRNFLVWKFRGKTQNFHTRKLVKITVFYAVLIYEEVNNEIIKNGIKNL